MVTHQLQVERRTAKAHRPKTNALPLDHTTNAGDCGITAENTEKSQHTDFNEDTTNESASVACSIAMYGCESWTLKKNEETHLEALEMKGLRKILHVSLKQMSEFSRKLE